jgi:hypothetical protein
LRSLRERVDRHLGEEEVLYLEALLGDLEDARASLGLLLARASPLERLFLLRNREHLTRAERRILARKRDLLGEVQSRGLDRDALRLALLRAQVRFGDVEQWKSTAERLSEGNGRNAEEARTLLEAWREEARLLRLASEAFLEAASRAKQPRAKAELLFLVADAGRRVGDVQAARDLLARVVDLAPASEAGRRAELLLSGE